MDRRFAVATNTALNHAGELDHDQGRPGALLLTANLQLAAMEKGLGESLAQDCGAWGASGDCRYWLNKLQVK